MAAEGDRDEQIVISADLFEVASLADLVLRLERAWARWTPQRLRSSVQSILEVAQAGISISGAGFALTLADRLPGTDPLAALRALLNVPSQLAERELCRTMIVLEDFQAIAAVPEAGAEIRRCVVAQRGIAAYLLSGLDVVMITSAINAPGLPVLVSVETLRLGGLPASELTEALRQRFASEDCDADDVLNTLVSVSEGHPQRAMLLAHMLKEELGAGNRATSDYLRTAVTATLRRVDPEVRAIIGGLTLGQRKVLRAVAEYGTPMSARAPRTLGLPKTTAQKAAPHLVATGLIEEAGREWRVVDPLLALWIRNNYGMRA